MPTSRCGRVRPDRQSPSSRMLGRTDAAGFSKRFGYTRLSSTRVDDSSRSDGRRCSPTTGAPCVVSGRGAVDVYSESVCVDHRVVRASVVMFGGDDLPRCVGARRHGNLSTTRSSATDFRSSATAAGAMQDRPHFEGPDFIVQSASDPSIPNPSGLDRHAHRSGLSSQRSGTKVIALFPARLDSDLCMSTPDCTSSTTVLAGWSAPCSSTRIGGRPAARSLSLL